MSRTQVTGSLPFWQQLRSRLVIYFVLLTITPLAIVATIFSSQSEQQLRQQVFNQLDTVALLKESLVHSWLSDGDIGLKSLLTYAGEREVLISLLEKDTTPAKQAQVEALLLAAVVTHPSLSEVFIYDTDGHVIAGSDSATIGKVVSRQTYFAPGLASETYIEPPYYDVGRQALAVIITRQIIDESGEVIGVLAGYLNVTTLGDIMTERTGLGSTGETYLVSHENNYLLTPSLFPDYPLNRAYNSEGITQALARNNGRGVYASYRTGAEMVFGVYRWLPELQSAMLTEIEEAEALTLVTKTRTTSVAVSVIAGLVAVAGGLFFAGTISRPISSLAQTASRIAQGDLTQRASIRTGNEIEVLADSFNQMTGELSRSISALDDKVKEVQVANQNLRVANAQVRETARLKSEFMATMSHELRTPLNALLGFSGVLLEGMGGEIDEDARHMVNRIQENSRRLLHMINDILDLAKIEAGRVDLRSVPIQPREIAEQWRTLTGVLATEKGLNFTVKVDDTLPETIYGDPERLTQIVVNLLSNAFKFTEKGNVNLHLQRHNHTWLIRVADTGIGIPPHALNYIFEEFRQVDGSSTRAYGGTGLGLAITRNLCRMMGGTIRVNSTLEEGSTFTVTLPLHEQLVEDPTQITEPLVEVPA